MKLFSVHRHSDVTNEIEGLPCICTYKYWRRRRTTTTPACETHLGQEIHSLLIRSVHARWSNWLTSCVSGSSSALFYYLKHTKKRIYTTTPPLHCADPPASTDKFSLEFLSMQKRRRVVCWLQKPNDQRRRKSKCKKFHSRSVVVRRRTAFNFLRTMLAI